MSDTIDLYAEACFLLQTLEEKGFQARLVGGCVRDKLLGLTPKDYDIATDALPEEVKETFEALHKKVIPTGIAFGTVSVINKRIEFQITTLRRDIETDGRKTKVIFSKDFKEDAARRDFTINALSEDLRGNLYDYFRGLEHLKKHALLFVGDASGRIQEDYLRILRYFRFKARFKLKGDSATLQAIRENTEGIKRLSQERVYTEMSAFFSYSGLTPLLEEMQTTGVLQQVLRWPSLHPAQRKSYQDFIEEEKFLENWDPKQKFLATLCLWFQRFAFLSHEERKEYLQGYKFSNTEIACVLWSLEGLEVLASLAYPNPDASSPSSAMEFVDTCEKRTKQKWIFSTFLCPFWEMYLQKIAPDPDLLQKLTAIKKVEAKFQTRRLTKMPVQGEDVKKIFAEKLESPKQIKGILESALRAFRDGKWHTREEGLLFLKGETQRKSF